MRAMVMRLGTRVSGFLAMGGENRKGGRGQGVTWSLCGPVVLPPPCGEGMRVGCAAPSCARLPTRLAIRAATLPARGREVTDCIAHATCLVGRAAFGRRRRQGFECRHRRVPADAAVGDRLAVGQAAGRRRGPGGRRRGCFDHDADDAAVAGGDLGADVGEDEGLVLGLLGELAWLASIMMAGGRPDLLALGAARHRRLRRRSWWLCRRAG